MELEKKIDELTKLVATGFEQVDKRLGRIQEDTIRSRTELEMLVVKINMLETRVRELERKFS